MPAINNNALNLAAILAREIPTAAPHWIADAVQCLAKLGRAANLSATALYNGKTTDQKHEAAVERIEREATRAMLALFRVDGEAPDTLPDGWEIRVGGDPRGYCLRLIMPSGHYNTWGGEESGWGI